MLFTFLTDKGCEISIILKGRPPRRIASLGNLPLAHNDDALTYYFLSKARISISNW
jgi:hypothetical protein